MTNKQYKEYITKSKFNSVLYAILSIGIAYLYFFHVRESMLIWAFGATVLVGIFSVWSKKFFEKRLKENGG
jgi:hypothetical protein